jgi:ABC-type Zn2+ transport system substrate-binding protein/surface adhesin
MRYSSLLLGGLLSTLAFAIQAQSHDRAHHDHGHEQKETSAASLDAHEHGVASLNMVLEREHLIIELDSPAANIVGFEHLPNSAGDFAALAEARKQLLQADALFAIADAAGCSLEEAEAESPLFEADVDAAEHEHHDEAHHDEHAEHAGGAHAEHGHADHGSAHSDIQASFHFNCANPDAIKQIEVKLFEMFPRIEKLLLQAITPRGQRGGELTPAQNIIRL